MIPQPSDNPSHRPRGEQRLIDAIFARLRPAADPALAVGLGDDMASIVRDDSLVWTTDMLMDGVDFRSGEHDWRTIGRKAMAVNLSDCAAMGVRPVGALVAVALCESLSMGDAIAIHEGAAAIGEEFGCPITGGDTNSWISPTVISITVAGRPDPGTQPILRSTGRPGDIVYCSGPVGGSILGRHLTFTPRVELGLVLARLPAAAMIDISDGLALDLWRLCEASGCGAIVAQEAVAGLIHPDAVALSRQSGRPAIEHALHDGEDFELLAAMRTALDPAAAAGLGLTRVARLVPERGLWLETNDGARRPLEPRGWEHFR